MYWKAIAVKRESTMEYLNKNSVNDLCSVPVAAICSDFSLSIESKT